MKRRGFTVIELMVVIVVIGLLAGMVLFAYRGARDNSRDTARRAAVDQLVSAIDALKIKYPDQQINTGGYRGTPTAADALGANGLCPYASSGWVHHAGHAHYPCSIGDSLIANDLLRPEFFTTLPPNEVFATTDGRSAAMMIYKCNYDAADRTYLLYYYVKQPTAEETAEFQRLRQATSCDTVYPSDTEINHYGMRAARKITL